MKIFFARLFKSWKFYVWIATTVLLVLYQGSINEERWALWVPESIRSVALIILMAVTMIPFIQDIRRENDITEESIQLYANRLAPRIDRLGETIVSKRTWTSDEARNIRQNIIDTLPEILLKVGIKNPRVCFYSISATDDESGIESAARITELKYECHAGGQQKPTDIITRPERQKININKEEDAAESMFRALDGKQANHLLNRPGHNKDSTWRSALRCPVMVNNEVLGILTVDSPQKNSVNKRFADIVRINAIMLGIAQSHIDNQPSPSMGEMKDLTSKGGNQNGTSR